LEQGEHRSPRSGEAKHAFARCERADMESAPAAIPAKLCGKDASASAEEEAMAPPGREGQEEGEEARQEA